MIRIQIRSLRKKKTECDPQENPNPTLEKKKKINPQLNSAFAFFSSYSILSIPYISDFYSDIGADVSRNILFGLFKVFD